MLPRRTAVLLLAVWVAAPHGASAEGSAPPAETRATEEIKAIDVGVWAAATACDEARWSPLVADDVALITPYGFVLDKARLLDSTTMQCDHEWKVEPLKVQVYDDVAVVIGNHTFWSKPDRNGHSGRYIYTRVYEKRDSRWQWVFGQHTIVTDTSNGGDLHTEPMTEQDKAILRRWK